MTTYRAISHEEVENTIRTVLDKENIQYTYTEYKYKTNTTKRMTFTLDKSMKLMGDDILPRVEVFNSLKKEHSLTIGMGCFRFVCSNGLTVGDVFFQEKIIHRVGPTFETKYDEIEWQVAAFLAQLKHLKDLEEELSTTLTIDSMINVTGNLNVPKKVKDKAIEVLVDDNRNRPEDRDNNVWTLFNIVNESISDKVESGQAKDTYNKNLLSDILILAA